MKTDQKNLNHRFVVDFLVTGRCDMDCPFCYGPEKPVNFLVSKPWASESSPILYTPKNGTSELTGSTALRPEVTTEQAKKIIDLLVGVGVTTINIGGGEPLLRGDTPALIKYAFDQGLDVYLSTNGSFLLDRYSELGAYIKVLGLSLDGSNEPMNVKMGRKRTIFNNVIDILKFFGSNPPAHQVKIGTVVSKLNNSDIQNIGELLFATPELYMPDTWRLYQFEPLRKGLINREKYYLRDEEFIEIIRNVEKVVPKERLSVRTNFEHKKAYFFVTPDGMLAIVDEVHRNILNMVSTSLDEVRSLIGINRDTVGKIGSNRKWIHL